MSEHITLDDLIGAAVDLRLDDGSWCYGVVAGIYPEDNTRIELRLAPAAFVPVYALQRTKELIAHVRLEELPVRVRKEPPAVCLHKNVVRIIEWDPVPSMAKQKAEEQYGRFLNEHPEFVVLYHSSMQLSLRAGSDGIYGYLVQAQLQRKLDPSARDTHFAGFAKTVLIEMLDKELVELLVSDTRKREAQTLEELNEIVSDGCEWKRQAETIIARRAYDLAAHIFNNMPSSAAAYEAPEVLRWIPDLTELPAEPKE